MNATMDAVEWLRERSEEYREKLEMGLTELQEYRENTGSVSLENDQNIVIEKLKALNSALTVAQTERIQAETAWNAIRGQVADKKTPASKLATLLPDAAVQDAFQKLLEQQREVANLKLRYRAQHPTCNRPSNWKRVWRNNLSKRATMPFSPLRNATKCLSSASKIFRSPCNNRRRKRLIWIESSCVITGSSEISKPIRKFIRP